MEKKTQSGNTISDKDIEFLQKNLKMVMPSERTISDKDKKTLMDIYGKVKKTKLKDPASGPRMKDGGLLEAIKKVKAKDESTRFSTGGIVDFKGIF